MGFGQKNVAVKTVSKGTDAWSGEKFLPGDIVEQLRLENQTVPLAKAPFAGGRTGFGRELRKLAAASGKFYVRVARQGKKLEIASSVAVEESVLRKQYALADYGDRSYIVTLTEATDEECAVVQDQTRKALESKGKSRISNVQMKDCLISYSWQQKMSHFLPPPNSAIVFSLLLMPYRASVEFNNVDDTSARAMAWLSASQDSGVPIIFVNIQTEPILRQGTSTSGFGVGSQEEAMSVANSGSYTIHEEAGTDIGVLRAIRLWYAPAASELLLSLIPDQQERLGVGISHSEEGFCYVSSVDYGTAADRAGLKEVHESARSSGKLVVISRIAGTKVTPWMVQSSGAIRCFDTLLISEIFSVHKQTLKPIQLYVMLWNGYPILPSITTEYGFQEGGSQEDIGTASPVQVSRDRTSTSLPKAVRWGNPVYETEFKDERRDLESPRSSHCSVRYFNGDESSEHEDFSFSF